MDPRVYVVVLNWNAAADTAACVESLRHLGYTNATVVVCDNASKPDDVGRLRNWGTSLPGGLPEYHDRAWPKGAPPAAGQTLLIHTGSNLGFAGGMNEGLRFALDQGDCDFVWLLNNDTAVDTEALTWLVRRAQADPAVGICGSSLLYFDDRRMVQALGGAEYQAWRGRSIAIGAFGDAASIPTDPTAVESRMAYVVGASMLVSRAFLDAVGPMDDSYFLYSEEHDWAHRGRRHGFRLGWAPRSLVFHRHGATIGTSPSGGSELSLFYLYRSKAMFAARHHPARLPVVLVSLLWDAAKFLLKSQPRKARAVVRGVLAFPRKGRF